jgi:O-antigen/teichoic acid export membrane protein
MALYSRERARHALFHTVAFRAISQVASILSYVVLVRGLSEHSLGIFSLLYSVIPVVGTVASLGLDQVLKRFQPEYLQVGNTRGSAWLVRIVMVARLFSSVALLVLLVLVWSFVAPLFKLDAQRTEFELFSMVVVLYFQVTILQTTLASHMLHRYSVGSAAVLAVSKLLVYFTLLRLGELELRNAILADAVAYALAYVFLFVAYRLTCRPEQGQERYQPTPAERQRLRRYAVTSNFSDAGSLLLYVQTDNFFVAALMNPVAVGAYAFYARLNEMAANLIPIRLFENVVQPLFFAVRREQAAERLPRYFSLLININLVLQLPLMAYTLVYHREIVQALFGGKFIEYSLLLPLIVAFAFSDNVISIPVTMAAQYSEKMTVMLKSQFFGIYQVIAMLTLIPIAGLYGAAIATGTLHLFRNLYIWWHVRGRARWLNGSKVVTMGLIIWGAAIAACYALKTTLQLPPIANLICGAVVIGVAGLVYIRSPAISDSDRTILGRVLHGREAYLLRWFGVLPRDVRPS